MSEKRPERLTIHALTTLHLGRVRPMTVLNGLTTSHLKAMPAVPPPAPPAPPASAEAQAKAPSEDRDD